MPKLTIDNYNEWERLMKHLFYAKEWEAMETASRQAPGPAVPGGAAPAPPRADDIDAAERRKAWGVLMASLNTEMLSKLDGVGLGEVEEALRTIRQEYYRDTTHTRAQLRRQLQTIDFENYGDIGTYVAELENLYRRMAGMGQIIGNEEKIYFLLEGLPLDYAHVVSQIRMPRAGLPELTWSEIVTLLRDYQDQHSNLSAANRRGHAGRGRGLHYSR